MSDDDLIRRGDALKSVWENNGEVILSAINALPAVQPAPVTVDDMPSDGTCKKCGCAPTNAEGRCHACADYMSDDLTPEAVERLCQMLLAVDKSRHGYTGHPRYNRDGMQAEQVIRALSTRLAEVEAERDSAVRGRNDWRDDYKALSSAIVGETGLSAMTVATQARLFRPRAEAAEAALATARADALREAAEICDDLAIGYAKHVGVPTALLDAKRDILAIIPKEQTK
jgi:hypothetical protein